MPVDHTRLIMQVRVPSQAVRCPGVSSYPLYSMQGQAITTRTCKLLKVQWCTVAIACSMSNEGAVAHERLHSKNPLPEQCWMHGEHKTRNMQHSYMHIHVERMADVQLSTYLTILGA